MASAHVLCACGDGRITDASESEVGKRYVAVKKLKLEKWNSARKAPEKR